jgi:hypothetical protein
MRPEETFDLYTILRKRNVSLEEWLDHHNIFSIEEFDKTAPGLAKNQLCSISAEMKQAAHGLLCKSSEVNIILPQKEEQSSLTTNSISDSLIPVEPLEVKKKRPSKKSSSNEVLEMVVLDTSDPTSVSEKETTNEKNKS